MPTSLTDAGCAQRVTAPNQWKMTWPSKLISPLLCGGCAIPFVLAAAQDFKHPAACSQPEPHASQRLRRLDNRRRRGNESRQPERDVSQDVAGEQPHETGEEMECCWQTTNAEQSCSSAYWTASLHHTLISWTIPMTGPDPEASGNDGPPCCRQPRSMP